MLFCCSKEEDMKGPNTVQILLFWLKRFTVAQCAGNTVARHMIIIIQSVVSNNKL